MSEKNTPRAKPPHSTSDVIGRLEEPPAKGRRVSGRTVVQLLVQARSLPFTLEEVHRATRAVRSADPSWQIALQILGKSMAEQRETLMRAVARQLTKEARQVVRYPNDVETSEMSGQIRAWSARVLGDASAQPAAMLVALWPDRNAPYFQDAAIRILELWVRWDNSIRSSGSFGRGVVQLFGGARDGTDLAEAILMVLEPLRSGAARFDEERRRFEAEIDSIRTSTEPLHRELAMVIEEREEDRLALAEARGRISELAEELSRVRNDATAREQELRQQHANELGRLRSKVLRVLERETEEIRLYLEDPIPHVAEALARLAYIERLHQELGEVV